MSKIHLVAPFLNKDDPDVFLKIQNFLEELVKQADTNDLLDGAVTSSKRTAIDVKVGSFTCPGSTGNHSVTGLGFQPTLVELICCEDNADNVRWSNGAMDSSGNQWALGVAIETAGGLNEKTYAYTNHVIAVLQYDTTVIVLGDYVSLDLDGFTINFTTANSDFTCLYKAYR